MIKLTVVLLIGLKGFMRIYEEMAEISIDVPLAYTVLDKFLAKCESAGFLPKDLIINAPSK